MGASGNKVIIVSAPSGAGKTTIVQHLLSCELELGFSVSATSRPPRPGETDGQDYFFLEEEEFRQKVDENEFVEWEEVYPGLFYGTLKSEVERIWKEGKTVIFDVDVLGGINLKKIYGEKALALFIMPPSVEVLRQRLQARSTESEEKIATRISKARYELGFADQYDQILVNDLLEVALAEAEIIVADFIASTASDSGGEGNNMKNNGSASPSQQTSSEP